LPQLVHAHQYLDRARRSDTRAYSIKYEDQEPLSLSQGMPYELWLRWQLAPAFAAAESQLERLAHVNSGWDSYGAEPPNVAARNSAARILSFLKDAGVVPTKIVPSAEGGVAICFVSGSRYADIECLNAGEILAVTYRGKEDPNVWETANAREEVMSAIDDIQAHFAF
jgi:hypothetical protein